MSIFLIKVLFIVAGLACCAVLFVAMSKDTERYKSAREWRKRARLEQTARNRQENKRNVHNPK